MWRFKMPDELTPYEKVVLAQAIADYDERIRASDLPVGDPPAFRAIQGALEGIEAKLLAEAATEAQETRENLECQLLDIAKQWKAALASHDMEEASAAQFEASRLMRRLEELPA
jgi:hypothetical protein